MWDLGIGGAKPAAFGKRFRLYSIATIALLVAFDETYIKIKGKWYYLYRAVDSTG